MAGIVNWFSFQSREQREQQQRDYFERMFPMGEPQRTREKELLKQCIRTDMQPNEKLYQLQIVKEALQEPDEKRRLAALKRWYGAPLSKKLPPQERAMLLALGELEQECRLAEDMPAAEAVHKRSEILQGEVIPKLLPGQSCFMRQLKKIFHI